MSAKSILYAKLTTDAALTALVPASSITQAWYNANLTHPQITLKRISEAGAKYGDNNRIITGSVMQIDIWHTASITAIETQVKRSLLEIDEHKRSDYRLLEPPVDTNLALNRASLEIAIYE